MSDSAGQHDDLFDEMHELITARLEHDISTEQLRRLEDLVISDPEARRIYVEYMRDSVALNWWATSPAPHLGDREVEQNLAALQEAKLASDLHAEGEAMQPVATDALAANDREVFADVEEAIPMSLYESIEDRIRRSRGPLAAVAAAAVVVLLITFFVISMKPENAPTNVATFAKSASAEFEKDTSVGDELPAGPMVLNEGAAQIDFGRGAMMTVEGIDGSPAIFELKTDNHVALDRGRLAVKVPPGAVGFTVSTPKYDIVDLGTEFAVEVDDAGEIQVHVFEGRVDIRPTADNDITTPDPTPLVAGEAIAVSDTAETDLDQIAKTTADTKRFTRDVDASSPLRLNSTGRGLDLHAEDPNWRVVSATKVPGFTPRQAVVVEYPTYLRNDRNASQWISFDKNLSAPDNALFTFETEIDLTNFDSSSGRIIVQFIADNELVACRVNGTNIATPPNRTEARFEEFHSLAINRGLRPGVNTIQFDVRNSDSGGPNPLAVRLHMTGTAKRIVQNR